MNRTHTVRVAGWTLLTAIAGFGAVFALEKASSKDKSVPVRTAFATFQSLNSSVTSNGKVVPLDDFQARAAFSGTVEKVLVHVGDKVKAGQLLIRMYDPYAPSRYAGAIAALKGAELGDENIRKGGSQEERINLQGDLEHAQLEEVDAEKQLTILQNLSKTGAASGGEIENAEHRLNAAATTVKTVRDRMTKRYSNTELSASIGRVADANASLQTARAVLANANVTSTISGTVYSLPVAATDFIPMGAELMRVTDLSKVQVRAYIDEPEIGQLAVGESATVTWEAKPDKIWHGHVREVPLTVSNLGSRVIGECVITIDDADGTLLPNTNVAVTIATSKPSRALTLPRAALRSEGSDSFVFRLINGKLARTRVQVGIVNTSQVQILAGLSEHDVVAVSSTTLQDLSNGLRVTTAP